MGMNVEAGGGKKRKVKPTMNVTPLVDVVLVLLIIFMVMTPLLAKQFWVHVPKDDEEEPAPPQDDRVPIVMTVDEDGTIRINKEKIEKDQLRNKLPRMFAAKGDAVLIFDADSRANYGHVVQVLDEARASGAVTIAVSPQEIR